MAFVVSDKKIDNRLEQIVKDLKYNFGIKHVTKTDALRFILKIREQGKKTNKKWDTLFK